MTSDMSGRHVVRVGTTWTTCREYVVWRAADMFYMTTYHVGDMSAALGLGDLGQTARSSIAVPIRSTLLCHRWAMADEVTVSIGAQYRRMRLRSGAKRLVAT